MWSTFEINDGMEIKISWICKIGKLLKHQGKYGSMSLQMLLRLWRVRFNAGLPVEVREIKMNFRNLDKESRIEVIIFQSIYHSEGNGH